MNALPNSVSGEVLAAPDFPPSSEVRGPDRAGLVLALVSGPLGGALVSCLAYAVALFGFLCALTAAMAIADTVSPAHDFTGWFLLPFILLIGTWTHEYGHVLGARANGMTPYVMQVGPMHFHARRRGWRMRWRRPERGYGGYVMALCNPDVPMRRQQLAMVAGGPLANLVVALLFGLPGLFYLEHVVGVVLLGFAGLNLAFAIGNLLPRFKGMATDGYLLLFWQRSVDPTDPRWVVAFLNALSAQGMTADELPAAVLAKLEGQEVAQVLPHLWFTLKAHQNRAEWSSAAALQPALEARLAEVPADVAKSYRNLIDLLRCEIAFSQVMAGHCIGHPIDRDLNRDLDWVVPVLRPRLQALAAAKAGDRERALSCLARAESLAADSIDKASVISEGRLRAAVLEMVPPKAA